MTITPAHTNLDVQTLRSKLGLTQQDLAEALGTSIRTIRRWEAGGVMHLIWQDRLTAMLKAKLNHDRVVKR